jgi:quercetin dioxygenase-like cupin family protein
MNIVPFRQGDMAGKRELAIEDARVQAEKTSGIRQKLYQLQESVGRELEPVECPLQHVFAPGAYARTMFIPAGTVIVGKIHKHAHLNILSQGTVCVKTETEGDRELTGPLTMVSPPGTKRAVYAVTDAVWTTIHLTNETDLEKIEGEVIAPTFEDYEQFLLGENAMNKIEVSA